MPVNLSGSTAAIVVVASNRRSVVRFRDAWVLGLQDVTCAAVMVGMKKSVVAVLGFVIVCGLAGAGAIGFVIGLRHGEGERLRQSQADRQHQAQIAHQRRIDCDAIVSVFHQAVDAVHSVEKLANTEQKGRENALVNKLAALDISSCPQDFRLAWFDYVTALQKDRRDTGGAALLDLLLGVTAVVSQQYPLAASEGSKVLAHAQTKQQEENAVSDALANVKRIAIRHGVVFRPIP